MRLKKLTGFKMEPINPKLRFKMKRYNVVIAVFGSKMRFFYVAQLLLYRGKENFQLTKREKYVY